MEPIKDYFSRYKWKETWKKDLKDTSKITCSVIIGVSGILGMGVITYDLSNYPIGQNNSVEEKQSIASVVRAGVNKDGKEDIILNRDGKEEVFYAKDMTNKGVWTRKYFNKLGMKKLAELDLNDKIRKAQKEFETELIKYGL